MADVGFTLVYRHPDRKEYTYHPISGTRDYTRGIICAVKALFDNLNGGENPDIYVQFNVQRIRLYSSEQLMWFRTHFDDIKTEQITLTGSVPVKISRKNILATTDNPPADDIYAPQYVRLFTSGRAQVTMANCVVLKNYYSNIYSLIQFETVDFIAGVYDLIDLIGISRDHVIRIFSGAVPTRYVV